MFVCDVLSLPLPFSFILLPLNELSERSEKIIRQRAKFNIVSTQNVKTSVGESENVSSKSLADVETSVGESESVSSKPLANVKTSVGESEKCQQ